jgi:hypothetical protein
VSSKRVFGCRRGRVFGRCKQGRATPQSRARDTTTTSAAPADRNACAH